MYFYSTRIWETVERRRNVRPYEVYVWTDLWKMLWPYLGGSSGAELYRDILENCWWAYILFYGNFCIKVNSCFSKKHIVHERSYLHSIWNFKTEVFSKRREYALWEQIHTFKSSPSEEGGKFFNVRVISLGGLCIFWNHLRVVSILQGEANRFDTVA